MMIEIAEKIVDTIERRLIELYPDQAPYDRLDAARDIAEAIDGDLQVLVDDALDG